jgi:RHS repeat-associated protein
VTDPAGRSLTFTYNASLLVTSMADAVGTIATFTYDLSWKRPTKVTYADGSFNTFTWDGANRLLNVKDTSGKVLEAHTYSGNKGLTSERANGVEKVTLSYPTGGNVTNVTDSLGNTTTYYHSALGPYRFVTEIVGPGCATCGGRGDSIFTYDGSANRTASTDALGRTTTYTYDQWGNVTSRSVPLDLETTLTWSYTYNSFGQVLTATDPLGNTTTNTYDPNGNLLTTTTPSPDGSSPGFTTTFAYDSLGQLVSVTDPRNNTTTFTYTSAGLLATVTDALNNATTYGYDARGNRTSVTDALNNTTTFTYNNMNRLTQVTYPDQSTTSFAYDNRGRRTSVTDANNRTTAYAYDDADRLISVTDAASNVISYGFDLENNLTSITDALGRTTSFAYDALGRVTATTFPSTLQETYTYDAVGNLLNKTDRKAQTIDYTYDALNRLTRKEYPDSTGVDYSYDALGRMIGVTDSTGSYEFDYDSLGRLIQTRTTYGFLPSRTFTISYSYDETGNRITMVDPENGTTDYTYDELNRLVSLSNFQSQMFNFSYDALSRRTQMTRPSGVNTNYAYDNLSHLLSVLHQLGGNTLDGATYTVDAVGNRTSKLNHLSSETSDYTYDAIYQLTQVVQGTTTESYTYDAVGNRLSSLNVSPYTYNSSNHLTSIPGTTYSYDDNGNMTSKTDAAGTSVYLWGYENQLDSVALPDEWALSFIYDAFGRRIRSASPSSTAIYVYDGVNVVEEVDASGAVLARYTQGLGVDEPLAVIRSGATHFYHLDGLSSTTSLTDASGASRATYVYDSFGVTTATTGDVLNPFRYTGREIGLETGLYNHRARYYDPSIGRFMGEDPIGFSAGTNFYSYVFNNPVNLFDPFGLDVDVCFYSDAAYGFGHVGFALPGDSHSFGFYPLRGRMIDQGVIKPDQQKKKQCKRIDSSPEEDECMARCRDRRIAELGAYHWRTRQCTDFVRECLTECGLPAGKYDGPRPILFFEGLPGRRLK